MSERTTLTRVYGVSLEEGVKDLLAGAKPLPFADEMIVDDLTDQEQRVFLDASNDA